MRRLKDIIGPDFYGAHWDIKKGRYTHYWFKGGRGSGKSSFISAELILGIMKDPEANGAVLRKVGFNIKNSVFSQLLWAIEALGASELWEKRVSVPELIYKPTGQRVIFIGGDNPKKIKSTKFSQGYCKYIWYEELDEFNGMGEIRNINQSLMRGGDRFFVFYSYNPPKSRRSWVNEEAQKEMPGKAVYHSTYLAVPKKWLGERFFIEAEELKRTRPDFYRHEYLGQVIGSGGEVFNNIELREISGEEISRFDRISRGLDWGFAVDPLHYTVNHYDSRRRKLYIFYEIHAAGLSNRRAAELIKEENKSGGVVICDSAEPKSVAELNEFGVRAIGAAKGPDSVEYGIKWLQGLSGIVIDPRRCPKTAKEFCGYEFMRDKSGEFTSRLPDKDNHSIDAVRYSREFEMRSAKVR